MAFSFVNPKTITMCPRTTRLQQPLVYDSGFSRDRITAVGMSPSWYLPEALPLLPNLVPLVVGRVQTNGENIFAAALMVSMIQAAISLGAYRSNPKGELIVPPGLTVGVEDASALGVGNKEKHEGGEAAQSESLDHATLSKYSSVRPDVLTSLQSSSLTSGLGEAAGRFVRTITRCLVLILPWLANQFNFFLERHGNIIHAAFLFVLTSVYDFGRKIQPIFVLESSAVMHSNQTQTDTPDAGERTNILEKFRNVIIIGDSFACGIGCVDTFDANKNSTVPMMRLEKLSLPSHVKDSNDGPAFPKAFAKTLSQRLGHPIHWRSAGVDGGDVNDISKFCLDIIREETSAGRTPNAVVLLCGTNDLKKLIANPLQLRSNSARAFRDRLSRFIRDVRDASSKETTVILPALPTHKIDKQHALNVVPLTFFLDIASSAWDSQKKLVADAYGRSSFLCDKKKPEEQNVNLLRIPPAVYLSLSAREVNDWYTVCINEDEQNGDEIDSTGVESIRLNKNEEHKKNKLPTLMSADGLHPNRQCYSLWGSSMANKYVDEVLLPLMEKTQEQSPEKLLFSYQV